MGTQTRDNTANQTRTGIINSYTETVQMGNQTRRRCSFGLYSVTTKHTHLRTSIVSEKSLHPPSRITDARATNHAHILRLAHPPACGTAPVNQPAVPTRPLPSHLPTQTQTQTQSRSIISYIQLPALAAAYKESEFFYKKNYLYYNGSIKIVLDLLQEKVSR